MHAILGELDGTRQRGILGFNDAARVLWCELHHCAERGFQPFALF